MYQKKKDKRSIQSNQWIYEALKKLINEKDYSKITIVDIVNEANIGRTTFYRNFNTIDDVLKIKCIEKFSDFREFCINYYKINNHKNKTFLEPFLNYWYDNSEIIELLLRANRESIIRDCLSKEINYFVNASSIKDNEIINSHLNYFIEIRIANCISILTEWIKNGKNIPPNKLAQIINLQMKESLKHILLI